MTYRFQCIECELVDNLINDLCIYLQEYGSVTEIRKMEDKYGFDYHNRLKKMGYEI